MRIAIILAFAISLGACSPEDFGISACSSAGRLAFRMHRIDGWLWNYRPRPRWIIVHEVPQEGGSSRRMWEVSITDLEKSKKRPPEEIVLYGQRLPDWQVETAPFPLRRGKEYNVHIGADYGRDGDIRIVAGEQFPTC